MAEILGASVMAALNVSVLAEELEMKGLFVVPATTVCARVIVFPPIVKAPAFVVKLIPLIVKDDMSLFSAVVELLVNQRRVFVLLAGTALSTQSSAVLKFEEGGFVDQVFVTNCAFKPGVAKRSDVKTAAKEVRTNRRYLRNPILEETPGRWIEV